MTKLICLRVKTCSFLFMAIFCACSYAYSQDSCPEVFKDITAAQIYWGQLAEDSKFPFEVEQRSQVFILGSGIKGGTVYRVKSLGGEIRTYKVYENEENAKSDLRKLKLLKQAESVPGYRGLKIARVIKLEGKVMEMENVFGYPLDKISNLQTTDSELNGAELLRIYREQVAATWEALSSIIPSLYYYKNDPTAEFVDANKKEEKLFLVPRNVIWEPVSKNFIVIDPY